MLLKYESRHTVDRGEVSNNQGQKAIRRKEFSSVKSHEVRKKCNENDFRRVILEVLIKINIGMVVS